jgi:hypothetical protein
MSDGTEHQWKVVPPTSMYDTLYECSQCGQRHFESLDNPDSYLPISGTEKAMCTAKKFPTNIIFSTGHIQPIKEPLDQRRFIVVFPSDPETADALETQAMNLEKVCNLMGTPPGMIKDGLTQQFLSDLDKYLAETFCSILPKTE